MKHHYDNEKHQVAVDCIVFGFEKDKLKLLLIKRDFQPEKGHWSLMGGFVGKEESLDEAAHRVLFELTGLKNIFLEQLYAFGNVHRDPAERTISVAYYSLIQIDDHNIQLTNDYYAKWIDIEELPELIFDHHDMVDLARSHLISKASHFPVGFELLPEKFSMPELQSLYEAIFDKKLDKRNFIRKITALDILVKLDEKKSGAGLKKAYLYQFNEEKYLKLLKTGNRFSIQP